jgi:lysophospholipase L1-like esterase
MTLRTNRLAAVAVALLAVLLPQAVLAAPNTGDANFSKYVALGDSLTAGFSSGSINSNYQNTSYPALIYRQATGQTTGFEQPTVSPPGLPGVLQLLNLVPVVIRPSSSTGSPTNLTLPRPYDNMAVPGAKVHDLLTKTLSTSASDPTDLVLRQQGFTQLQQGLSLRPTFVTLWIGNNDVLGAATSGIAIVGVTLTPPAQFEAELRGIAGAIRGTGAKLAIANIPDVTSIPFVTALTRFVPNPSTGAPLLVNGQPVPLIGPNGPLAAGDFVLLTATAELAQGHGIPAALGGTGRPLSDNVVLSAAEVQTIRDHRNEYNRVINSIGGETNTVLVDTAGFFSDVAAHGLNVGGITLNAAFLTGGLFSYDGVHPNALGYAITANLFIDTINAKFNGHIPEVDLFPFLFEPAPVNPSPPVLDGLVVANTPYYFSPEAWLQLEKTLGIPTPAEIQQQIKKPRRRGRH